MRFFFVHFPSFLAHFLSHSQAPRGTKETLEEISEASTQKKCSCSLYSPLLFSCHTLVFRDVSLDSIVGRKASCHEKPFCIFERSTERVKHRPSYPHSRHSRVFGLPASARACVDTLFIEVYIYFQGVSNHS